MRWRIVTVFIVLAIAAGALLAFVAYSNEMKAAHDRLVGRSKTIETEFGPLEYAEVGSGEPVLVIHGSGGGFDQGIDMAGALTEAGYRLIAPSRFGYLGSAMPEDATIEMQADALAALLDTLGISEIPIFGGSAGALSAMQLAIRHPERCRALVLLVPAAYAPTRAPNTAAVQGEFAVDAMKAVLSSDFLFWAGMKLAPGLMTKVLLATEPALVEQAEPSEQQRVSRILSNILPVSVRKDGLIFDTRTAGAPEAVALDRILCPVLTISFEDDLYGTAAPAEYIAANVPHGTSLIYPSGGHVWVGHHDAVWDTIRDFLRDLDAAAPNASGGSASAAVPH